MPREEDVDQCIEHFIHHINRMSKMDVIETRITTPDHDIALLKHKVEVEAWTIFVGTSLWRDVEYAKRVSVLENIPTLYQTMISKRMRINAKSKTVIDQFYKFMKQIRI